MRRSKSLDPINKMKKLFFLVALIINTTSFSQNAEENISKVTLTLTTITSDYDLKPLLGVKTDIYLSSQLLKALPSNPSKVHTLELYLQNEYLISFHKEGYDTVQFIVNTKIPKNEEKEMEKNVFNFEFPSQIKFSKVAEFERPLKISYKIYFDSNSGFFEFDNSYSISRSIGLSKQGAEFIKMKNYKLAERYLTLSINLNPIRDSYYNRAIARINQENFIGFCEDLKSASGLGDEEAVKLLQEKCYKSDTLYFNQDSMICKKDEHSYSMYYRKSKFSDYKFIMYRNNKDSIKLAYTDENNERIYSHVDTFPKMGTEKNEFYNFLAKNIRYPPLMKEKGIQGTVYVSFIVETDGSISDIDIIESPDEMLSEEVLRLLKQMPTWKPAIYRGIPIKFELVLPIRFSLR